jgi:hypothetical protein
MYGSIEMKRKQRKLLLSNKLLIDIFGDNSDAEKVVDEAFKKLEKKEK